MRYLVGIDVGTSATKTVLFDENCQVIASASEEYPLYQPQNGWAELRPGPIRFIWCPASRVTACTARWTEDP